MECPGGVPEISRLSHPLTQSLGAALGLDTAQLRAAFRAAAVTTCAGFDASLRPTAPARRKLGRPTPTTPAVKLRTTAV